MEHRIKRDPAFLHLVTEFEKEHKSGNFRYLDVKAFSQLVEYYESEGALLKAIEVANAALSQYKYRAEFYVTLANLNLLLGKAKKASSISTKQKL